MFITRISSIGTWRWLFNSQCSQSSKQRWTSDLAAVDFVTFLLVPAKILSLVCIAVCLICQIHFNSAPFWIPAYHFPKICRFISLNFFDRPFVITTLTFSAFLEKMWFKGGGSSSQFWWFIAKIELKFLIFFVSILGLWLQRYSTNA